MIAVGVAATADTVAGNTLCRLSPGGSLVARITSRAAIRTRTVVPASSARSAASSVPPSNVELEQPALTMPPHDARVEDTSQADGLAQPRQVRTTREIGQRSGGDRLPSLENEQPRGQTNNVVEIMCDEHERDVERPSQLVDLVLQSSSHRSIDGSKRLVEQQHGRLASQCARERNTLTLAP